MKRYSICLLILLMALSLSGCVMFFGNWGALGMGERIVEYDKDGKIKKETTKSKSILSDIVNVGVFNK